MGKERNVLVPNFIGTKLVTDEEKMQLYIAFGKANSDKSIDILDEIQVSDEGFKNILKRLLDFADEIEEKSGRSILDEILEEYEENGGEANDV